MGPFPFILLGMTPFPLGIPSLPPSSQAHNSLSLTLVLSYHTMPCFCVVHWTMAMAFKEYTSDVCSIGALKKDFLLLALVIHILKRRTTKNVY
jgi:hypothetical protein